MKIKYRIGAGLAFLLAATAAMAQQIQVVVNGNPVTFPGQGPMMSGERVLVPLRGVLEQIGAHVDWDPATQTVGARRGATTVSLHIGQTTAAVNGQPVTLDVPAQIVNGSTMVPLRFVGEALGESVKWDAPSSTVTITDSGNYHFPAPPPNAPPPPPRPPVIIRQVIHDVFFQAGSVFPVRLDADLNSDENQRGDRFNAYIRDNWAGFPRGTFIEGFIVGIRRFGNGQPGAIDVRFDHVDFPNGHRYPIFASLVGIDDRFVDRSRPNQWMARPNPNVRAVFAGVGAGTGLIIGINSNRPMEDATIGAMIGLALGAARPGPRPIPGEVRVKRGTEFGIRLDRPITVNAGDLR